MKNLKYSKKLNVKKPFIVFFSIVRMSSSEFVAKESVESSDYDEDEDSDEQDDYYMHAGEDEGMASDREEDPEHFHYTITDSSKAEEMFVQLVAKACQSMKVKVITTSQNFIVKSNNCKCDMFHAKLTFVFSQIKNISQDLLLLFQ